MSNKTLFPQALDRNSSTLLPGMTVGDLRVENNKVYMFQKYNPGADEDLVANQNLYYEDVVATSVTGDISDVSGTPILAGLAVNALDLGLEGASNVAYIWLQIEGQATVVSAIGGAPADGGPVVLSGAQFVNALSGVVMTHGIPLGVTIDTSAKTIFLRCVR